MLEPTLFLEANKRRIGEGLEIHSLFDGYETKKVRAKKRKSAEESKEGKEKSARLVAQRQARYRNTEHRKKHASSPEAKKLRKTSNAEAYSATKMKCSRNLSRGNKSEVSAKAGYRNPSRKAFCKVCDVGFDLDPKRGKDKSRKCPDCRKM